VTVKIKMRSAGADELLKSAADAKLQELGERLAAAAGPGFEAEPVFHGQHRSRVTVKTATPEAMVAEAREHILIRALGQL
jgi:hypothetical protein